MTQHSIARVYSMSIFWQTTSLQLEPVNREKYKVAETCKVIMTNIWRLLQTSDCNLFKHPSSHPDPVRLVSNILRLEFVFQ